MGTNRLNVPRGQISKITKLCNYTSPQIQWERIYDLAKTVVTQGVLCIGLLGSMALCGHPGILHVSNDNLQWRESGLGTLVRWDWPLEQEHLSPFMVMAHQPLLGLSGSAPSVRKDTQSGLVARYRGCVTKITSWRAEETRWTTMVNRRNLLLSLLFLKVYLADL